tara:strand:- start:549 stop:737 length:189 start_codon:yes stop_codon:yes gene_type:complete
VNTALASCGIPLVLRKVKFETSYFSGGGHNVCEGQRAQQFPGLYPSEKEEGEWVESEEDLLD